MSEAPETIWIDSKGIPASAKYAGTYYLEDDPDHETLCYIRADVARTNAEQAVAVMVQRAVPAVVQSLWPVLGGNHTEAEEWHRIANACESAILALTPTDALKYNDGLDLPGDMPMVSADLVNRLRAQVEAADKLAEAVSEYLRIENLDTGIIEVALSAYEGAKE